MSRLPLALILAAVSLAGCGQSGNLTLPDKKPAPRPTTATRPVQSPAPGAAVAPAADPGHEAAPAAGFPTTPEDPDHPAKKDGTAQP